MENHVILVPSIRKRVDPMLGERIALLRSRLGWSQAELARRLNISPSAVGMYEQGRREPSVDMLVSLSRTLGVSMDFLLTGRTLCQNDCRAMSAISGGEGQKSPGMDFMRLLSREELMVLLTASLFSRECE